MVMMLYRGLDGFMKSHKEPEHNSVHVVAAYMHVDDNVYM